MGGGLALPTVIRCYCGICQFYYSLIAANRLGISDYVKRDFQAVNYDGKLSSDIWSIIESTATAGVFMIHRSFTDEAKHCRDLATELADGEHRPVLLGIAEVFDELAVRNSGRCRPVIGPLGEPLTLESLPASNTKRWTPRRKAEVVAAVAGGLLPVHQASDRYQVSLEEFSIWQRTFDRCGMPGLRVTRTQEYRNDHVRH